MDSRRFWYFLVWGSFITFVLLLSRKTGIHCDENNYLHFSLNEPLGDSFSFGKPVLFYLLNFGIFHTFGKLLGPFQAFSVYCAYLVFNNFALAWLLTRMKLGNGKDIALWAIWLTSPVFVFNSSQVMMETPLIGVLTFLVGALTFPKQERVEEGLIALTVVIAILLKESSLPALLTLTVGFYLVAPLTAKKLAKWVAFALIFNFGLRKILNLPEQPYGGISFLWMRPWPPERLSQFLTTWFFYCGPLIFLGALTLRSHFGKKELKLPFICIVASLFFSLLTGLLTLEPFDRYIYPCIWVAILYLGIVSFKYSGSKWARSLVITLHLILMYGLLLSQPLAYWPSSIRAEAVRSGFTVLYGFPNFAMLLKSIALKKEQCIFIPEAGGEHVSYLRQYFRWAYKDASLFDETSLETFRKCQGEAILAKRTHWETQCSCLDNLILKECISQPIEAFFERQGNVLNTYCSK